MKLFALDLGSTVGWATRMSSGAVIHAQKEFKGSREIRAAAFKKWLENMFTAYDVVVYERPFARGLHATRSLWGLAGIVEAVATEYGCSVLDQVPGPIKKWATGKGNANKQDMQVAALKLLGKWTPNSRIDPEPRIGEHEADAVCLLFYAEEHIS